MNIKNYYISCVLLLMGFVGFAQKTPENLIRGTESSKNITSKPIFSDNRKVTIQDRSDTNEKPSAVSSKTSSEAGTTPADFSVSLSGGATYNIPIAIPPGVRDISPNIGLNFNSQASNGLAGWGWGFSGLSTISRVSSTEFHDGFVDGVDFDLNDRFSLDGQRLLLKSGTYGATNSTYQTETYSNIKIQAYGTSSYGASYGPSYFIVYYPDGSRVWYGLASGSRNRLEWAVYKKVDAQGNKMEYFYIYDGELRAISRIRFGSRTGIGPGEILFSYKTRKRPELSYVNGIAFKRTRILDRIETRGNGQTYRKYVLTHDETPLGYERLTSVEEYNKANQSLTPVNFSYDNSSSNPNPDTYAGSLYPGYNYQTDNILSGEFNGDGKLDFILYNKNTRNKLHLFDNIYESSYNNTEIGRTYNVSNFDDVIGNSMLNHQGKKLGQQGITLIKENISGNTSSIEFKSYYHGAVGLYYHYTKTWNAPTYSYESYCGNSTRKKIPKEYISGDFNGDGLTDVLAIGKPYTNRYCYEYECPGGGGDPWSYETIQQKDESDEDFAVRKQKALKQNKEQVAERTPITIDPGDGGGGGNGSCCSCSSYTTNYRTAYFIDLDRNLTSGFANWAGSLQQEIKSDDRVMAADFNGDGKTDLFHFTEGKAFVYELNSNNQLSLIYTETDSYIKMNRPILLGDYNGDGKTDFLVPTANNSRNWRFFLSRGTNILKYTKYLDLITYVESQVSQYYNYSDGPITDAVVEIKFIAQDVNGDGKTDLIKHWIASAYSTNHEYSEDVVNIHVNKFTTSDTTPSFEHTSNYLQTNTGIKKFGVPIFLDSHSETDNIEYAYVSANHLSAYEFEGDHRKDVTLEQINNNGTSHLIDYAGLTNQGNYYEQAYTGSYDEIYPYVNVNIVPSLKLVSKVRETSSGSTRTQNFKYSGAVSHADGLGLLGFKQVAKSNINGYGVQSLWNITDFDIQKRGSPTRNWISTSSSTTPYSYISKNDYTYQTQLTADKVFINLKSQVISEDALTGITSTKAFSYDSYYSPTTVTTTLPGGSETITQQYINNPSPFDQTYTIGRLSEKTTTNVLNGDTFSTSKKYFYSNNLMTQVRRQGNGTPWLYEYYQYDIFGNILQKKVTGIGVSDRIENFEFDASGRYMTKSIDDEGLETTYAYNIATGDPISVTNAYGLPVTYQYDDWNRVTRETNYLGKHTYTTYANNSTYGTGGLLKTTNYDQGEDQKIYYNALGWVMKEGVLSINNKWIFKNYEYDVAGKKLKESEPYFSTSSPAQWNQYFFDQYGRSIAQQLFTGKVINTTYSGLSATVDDGTKTVTSTKDALGNIISIQDDGGTINYTYYANGKMKSTNYDSHIVNVTIDGWGRKIALTDPSAGTYTYQYNILGETLQAVTPKGTTSYQYSPEGKLIRKEVVGDQTNIVTDYEYNPATKLLKRILAINNETGTHYDYNYFYDSSKRINKITEGNGAADFEKQLTYDSYGRINKEVYITNTTSAATSNIVSVKNVYDTTTGILREIRDFNTNVRLWRINTENARGKALSISLGNGIIKTKQYDQYGFLTNVYDRKLGLGIIGSPPPTPIVALNMDYNFDYQRGILNSRKNYAFANWNENFSYDSLDRLTQISGAVNQQQEYDQRGRITDNSSVGVYNYNNSNAYRLENIDLNNQGDLYYQQNELQQITYNAFKKPIKIFQKDKGIVNFEYGPFMNRTHAYYGGLQEDKNLRQYHKQYSSIIPVEIIEDNNIGSTKIITYIGGDAYSAPIAHIKKEVSGSSSIDEYHYLHRDYLGSILAISNASTEIVEKRQFGAWGATDQFVNIQGDTSFGHDSLIGRGFTGHEHFFEVALIHMNGRMYDAKLGRFLSPDNFIQDPYNTQSFNRYGYVWNNPLSFSDPSGEIIWAAVLVGVIVGAISGAAAYIGHAIQTGNWSWGGFGMAILGGAIVGGLTYGIAPSMVWSTGSILSIAAGGFVGAFLPSFNIPIGDWNISISPSIAFGNAAGIGASLSVGYSDGNWSFSAGIGYMNYGNYNGFGNGVEIRKSILAAYDDGKTGFSLGTNWWSGNLGGGNDNFHQQTGMLGIRSGDFRLRYENDGKPFSGLSGDGNDQYRTAALELGVGEYSVGFNLFTGKRNKESYKAEKSGQWDGNLGEIGPYKSGKYGEHYKNGLVKEVGTKYRLGALTFGYKGYKLGVNSEWVRHAIQNVAIHGSPKWLAGQRMFEMQSNSWNRYFQYKTPNMFTSW
ncbi:tRNA(Glu)-specific nuclease WapA [Kordia antarctica]|uniref:tRNA(Glu)-specific nuclease WapA n=1 Tax=Kordia antarctica TaxID=1218801 RepID=A0A7L4ZP74_9FLAO|nr:polymorphic toxin type 23 domain-containing protein [Kordia antarctica]QHI38239.1 tRNA(Glu)-specific nuclease WapA [Kordia antarctica]